MKKLEAVLNSVTEKITPTERERKLTERVLHKIMEVTERVLKPMRLKHTLAGSFLRDTWLTDKTEFDIFILFPDHVTREKLEKQGLQIGKKIVTELKGKYEIAYAEHPYIRARVDNYAVDFVPCYDIKDPGKIKSAVDRTPHHNRYILKKLTRAMTPEVRLLKQFCKGIGVYGSDLRVEGFSGYLTELLIIKYKTFKNLLLEASKWEAGKVVIDLARHHKIEELDVKKKYPDQPLIVIDPVDSNRNVAAALSPANFELFRQACESMLKSPSEKYFRPQKSAMDKTAMKKLLKKRGTKLICVIFKRPAVVDDVLFPQLRRSAKRVNGMLNEADFKVLGHSVWCDETEGALLFELEVWSLPRKRKVIGPSVFSKKHSKQFIKKYQGKGRIWVDSDKWVTETSRQDMAAVKFVEKNLRSDKKTLSERGIASYVATGLKKGFSILTNGDLIKKAGKNREFAMFMTQYFKKRII